MRDRCRLARFAGQEQAEAAAAAVGAPWRARYCLRCDRWHVVNDERPTIRLAPSQARAVIGGRKTTHRIPAGRVRHCPYRVRDGHVENGHEVGVYALEYEQTLTDDVGNAILDSKGRRRVTWATGTVITVTQITREPLQDITDETAQSEGFANFGAFLDYWAVAHVPVDEDGNRPLTDRRMASDVWVVHFTAHQQDTVWLLPGLPDEPEAIDPAIVADLPASRDARQRHQRIQLEAQRQREAMPLSELVAREIAAAREVGVDTRVYEESILRRLRALRNRARRAA